MAKVLPRKTGCEVALVHVVQKICMSMRFNLRLAAGECEAAFTDHTRRPWADAERWNRPCR